MATLEVTPKLAARALEVAVKARQPIMLWGAPGIGKSQIVAQTAERLSVSLLDMRLPLYDAVDIHGVPYTSLDEASGAMIASWAQPSIFPREGRGVWFLDEINRAPVMVQNAAFQLILDRRIGDYILPDGWVVVAAGNRESDGGGVTRMPSALANRFVHLEMVPDLDDWSRWGLQNGINPLLVAFLRYRPNLLCDFDRNAHAYPTPRSWEFVNRIIGQDIDADLELPLIAGSVGQGAAIEFMAFLKIYRSLPDIDSIFMNPEGAPIPDRQNQSALWATAAAVGARITRSNFGRAAKYLKRISVEFDVFAIDSALKRDASIAQAGDPDFMQWALSHAEYM